MWRLIIAELADKSVYKGQRLSFMSTIKAQVKAIYCQGRKVQSAFFGKSTKPIFRSESAHYVVFIQMSKEMWDFEPEGTGELMFNKVINGFLPELFGRWQSIGARHLVSIILFTRMEYEWETISTIETSGRIHHSDFCTGTGKVPYKDFYRVLVSDMASGQWTAILTQLKRDFKTFLRDVTVRAVPTRKSTSIDKDKDSTKTIDVEKVIIGRPAAATNGNILEAINVASSQFSSDYIDRDLVRTGLSIIIITPSTGIFEVDSDLLKLTTDVLVGNGVGIDLVCLSRMPLHSVPLFKYKRQASSMDITPSHILAEAPQTMTSPRNNLLINQNHSSQFRLLGSGSGESLQGEVDHDEWLYAIPHWIDVSFWDSVDGYAKPKRHPEAGRALSGSKSFVPRIRMYEIQMMGIMENEMSNVSMPYLCELSLDILHKRHRRGGVSVSQRGSVSSINLSPHDSGAPRTKTPHSSGTSFSPSRTPHSNNRRTFDSLICWLDDYDDALFKHPIQKIQIPRLSRDVGNEITDTPRKDDLPAGKQLESQYCDTQESRVPDETAREDGSMLQAYPRDQLRDTKDSSSYKLSHNPRGHLKPSLSSRQFSFGFRGFGGAAPKAIPVTELSSEVAHPESLLSRGMRSDPLMAAPRTSKLVKRRELGIKAPQSAWNETRNRNFSSQVLDSDQVSEPVSITSELLDSGALRVGEHERRSGVPENLRLSEGLEDITSRGSNLLPHRKASMSWLTVLNPSNPHKVFADPTARLGRWHHVFPRPLHASNIKWKSLCSPASIPLTTEDFPSLDQLKTDYSESGYSVTLVMDASTLGEDKDRESLLKEMISARFCHGFQIVVGARLSQVLDLPQLQEAAVFSGDLYKLGQTRTYMSRGNQIHCLSALEGTVDVKQYVRNSEPSVLASDGGRSPMLYKPAVRTTLSEEYITHAIKISSTQEAYDWQRLDEFIAKHECRHSTCYPERLHFWRARFVLIPALSPYWQVQASNEDNEEEIRLEGIRKLTQMWQKNRYVAPEERRFQSASRTNKDPNPLDIIYRTRHPSAVVEAELNETLLLEDEGVDDRPTQLLPESDRFERSNLNLASLAQVVQGDRGIKMIDRWWHLKLHYNCFIGLELTTWLRNNFRDVDSREEAVELGNELMKGGLFVHVEKRHNFRDGNFFYQIANGYRAPRAESRSSWFGRLSSVPSTPIADNMRNLPGGLYARPSTSNDDASDDSTSIPNSRARPRVALSKSLIYDVDHRKRSYRQELITIHYDRISSADDCYHLRIDWMNVTPKLIEDAITSWATLGERFGLRLVELPINEVSRINQVHPFRGPYVIPLAKLPPEEQPYSYSDKTSLTPKTVTSFPYHKELLKKFNFVLDLEAASDFPSSVDVSYSWGPPEYQYPQFISRDGTLLAQITKNGNFLLFVNWLCKNRSVVTARDAIQTLDTVSDDYNNNEASRSPARAVGIHQRISPCASPSISPTVRATSDFGLGLGRSDLIAPGRIKNELESFCLNPNALDKFYNEVLQSKHSFTESSTPLVGSITGPLGPPPALSLTSISSSSTLEASRKEPS